MDFDLRQWLLVLGPIVIAGVLVHGYVRMRSGQNQIKMKLDKSFVSQVGETDGVDDLNLLRAELPNGGARVIVSDPADEVPVLEETVDLPSSSAIDQLPAAESPDAQAAVDQHLPHESDPAERHQTTSVDQKQDANEPSSQPSVASSTDQSLDEPIQQEAAKESPGEGRDGAEPVAVARDLPEMFIVVHVLALGEPFPGQALLEILLEAGMTFGSMDIFHRQAGSEVQFSLANAVEPGTFDVTSMNNFTTPGVTLFMRVHELGDPVRALDDMLVVADAIALELGGEVRDETRSVMTPQTIEHCRQSIREFQFKHSA